MLTPPGPAPRWSRPEIAALCGLLVATAVALTWRLRDVGWSNEYYSAVVQAGAENLRAAFYTSPDIGAATASDKPPLAFWPMIASVRVFGLHGWAIALPQVLETLATVAVLHATVRRVGGVLAGLAAAAVCATTPIFFALGRFNDPDTLLTLTTTVGAWCAVRAASDPRRRWLVGLGAALGAGFLTKWLAAAIPALALVLPVLALRRREAAPGPGARTAGRALAWVVGTAALTGGWWVLAFLLTPAASRPFPDTRGGNVLDLVLGQNGFSRFGANLPLTRSDINGLPGPLRLVTEPFTGQVGWLVPVAAAGVLWALWRAVRTRRLDYGWAVFGGWFLLAGLVFSFMRGAMHPYYTALLAPAIGACVGLALADLRGRGRSARRVAAVGVVLSALYAVSALSRTPSLAGWRAVVVGGALLAVVALLAGPAARGGPLAFWRPLAAAGAALALLAGPAAYGLSTLDHRVAGANPVAGPAEAEHGHGPYPAEFVAWLATQTDGGRRWVAAVPTATAAAALQLQSGRSVLVLGGFTGQAGFPQPQAVDRWVADGDLRWLVLQGPYWSRDNPQGMVGTRTDAVVQAAITGRCRFTAPGAIKVVDLRSTAPCPGRGATTP